jgi:endonuclease/exonuclease/phosphatase family metal-dependent hydrolase
MEIKLLQWNVWYKENFNNIVNELTKIDADIVTIQEFNISTQNIEKIHEIYPHIYYEVAQEFPHDPTPLQGNAILSKFPITKTKRAFIQEPSGTLDYDKEGRVYLEAKIKVGEKTLEIGTTHSSYTHRFQPTPAKDIEMNKLINMLKRHKENYVFAADLNTLPSSKYILEINSFLRNFGNDVTWTTKPFSYNGFENRELNTKLDYVFATRDVVVKGVEVVDTSFSDHLPILVTLIA